MRNVLACLGIAFCLVFFPVGGEVAGVSAAEAPTNSFSPDSAVSPDSAYERALRNAEKDLEAHERENGNGGGWTLSAVFSLAALLLAIALMFWAARWTRRFSFLKSGEREMRILDRMVIGKQATLLLIRVRGRDYWLAEHSGGVTPLADWPASEADNAVPPASFTKSGGYRDPAADGKLKE